MARHEIIDERLVAYAAGELGPSEAAAVERTLAQSPEHARCVAELRGVLAAMAQPGVGRPSAAAVRQVVSRFDERAAAVRYWLERVDRLVLSLVFDSGARPSLAGFRGGESPRQLAYESGDASVDLQVTPSDQIESGAWKIRGQVATTTGAASPVNVLLVDENAERVSEGEVDECGRFLLMGEDGEHSLLVELDDGVSAIEIEGLVLS